MAKRREVRPLETLQNVSPLVRVQRGRDVLVGLTVSEVVFPFIPTRVLTVEFFRDGRWQVKTSRRILYRLRTFSCELLVTLALRVGSCVSFGSSNVSKEEPTTQVRCTPYKRSRSHNWGRTKGGSRGLQLHPSSGVPGSSSRRHLLKKSVSVSGRTSGLLSNGLTTIQTVKFMSQRNRSLILTDISLSP